MLGILSSLFGGGLTGLLGSVFQRFFEYKSEKLKIESEKNRFAHELSIAKAAAEAKVGIEDAKAFSAALTSEPKRFSENVTYTGKQAWMMVVLDFMRGIIRPGLTIYLCAITTLLYIQARQLIDFNIPVDMAVDLVKTITNTILYLTTTCVLFWFGTRNSNKKI